MIRQRHEGWNHIPSRAEIYHREKKRDLQHTPEVPQCDNTKKVTRLFFQQVSRNSKLILGFVSRKIRAWF